MYLLQSSRNIGLLKTLESGLPRTRYAGSWRHVATHGRAQWITNFELKQAHCPL